MLGFFKKKQEKILIIGLGNPEKKFENTRHNLGFQVIDFFSEKNHFPAWQNNEKFLAKICSKQINRKKIILVKPQTFMNKSGKAVKLLSKYYKVAEKNIWVVHDDLDILMGKIKISEKRGAGGHKGIESIIKHLKTKNFVRFRIGASSEIGVRDICELVLKKFSPSEVNMLKQYKIMENCSEMIMFALEKEIKQAMNKYN